MGKANAVSAADEQEIAEARGSTLPDMLYDVLARAAITSIGQFVYKRVDNLLWTVEKTARWSLPQNPPIMTEKTAVTEKVAAAAGTEESEDAGTNISGPPLIRPLPWLLFLPALIVLRLIRTVLSMGARAIGRGPVLPATMVGFLQNKRRKLRALKYRGQRLQRISRLEVSSEESPQGIASSWLQRIILPLKMVICTRPYRATDLNSDVAHAVVFRKDQPSTAAQKRSVAVSKKRNLNQREAESDEEGASDEDSFEDAGYKELLDKYANVDDSSFNVDDISSPSDDSISSQSDADPSPKKPTLEADKKLNGGSQQAAVAPKPETLKRSASEHKNGIDASAGASKNSTSAKSINPPIRSQSAADLEKGNNAQSSASVGTDGNSSAATSSTTTPSKSIPNLTSSPENNENKPINHNIPGVVAGPPVKSPTPTSLKPLAKQSPTMSDVRNSFQQQKQTAFATKASHSGATAPQQQMNQQQQQHMTNGGKSRNKKPSTQSAA
ncbi:uncharacterized protein LOC131283118 [Anopheles ziemanni]|uniref:uncharacterized protein LOC131267478 n=1 Tax=Anopheles coustani TaxID=139045 RepID=UPI002657CEBF|nr:uncharacterized protein LOC131267478 [Anopheles coustani]XP_058126348.1 uncharacterized protein LOC131267478 [Anopheles coustani]XP_058168678.1 uncharacterized protein LOC131283118 [Anopheles ziemanni]